MGDRLFDGFNVLFMLFILFVTLYPFWEQLVMSFSSGYAVYEGGIKLWPKQFSLEAFQVAFDYDAIWVGYRNTIFRAIIGTAFSLMVSAMLAYPLSKPVLATVGLWIMVSHWNAWLDALLYVRDPAKQVLQIILRNILVVNDMTDINNVMNEASRGVDLTGPTLKAAVVMMSILPMLIIYPFIQKYFTKGVMVGSVKG